MTLKDVFGHLVSWRWQFGCWTVLLHLCLVIDLCLLGTGVFTPDTINAFAADVVDGAFFFFVVINVAWTFLKVCIAVDLNPFWIVLFLSSW